LQLARKHGHRTEELRGLLHLHLQDVVDGATLVVDLERLAVVAAAVADVARYVDVGQEVHFDFQHAVALTCLAASAFHVE
jgi:hypothetical protein